ncbi:MAG TPA: cyclic nucleotide-binding domain-containing protein [Gammaproteobacteria bacterium]|nr:cyclic nucleotide-binding domain-containing protein [Gammaproteobacteria bacterium]
MLKTIDSYRKCKNCAVVSRCFFSHVHIEQYCHESEILELQPGEPLLQAGKLVKYLYVVKSGTLKNLLISGNGDEIIAGFTLTGEIVDIHAQREFKSIVSTVALEASQLCFWPLNDFFVIFHQQPQLAKAFVYLLLQRKTDDMIIFLNNLVPAIDRVEYFLRNIFERTHLFAPDTKHSFRLSMSREEIGNYLNLSTETVSRMLRKLQDIGKLRVKSKNIFFNY